MRAPVTVVDDGERFAPVTLPGEEPVPELVLHAAVAAAVCLQSRDDRLFGLCDIQAVQVVGMHEDAVAGVGLLRNISSSNDFDGRQAECVREVPVALIMSGNGHDGAGAVAREDVVGDEHRDRLAVRGIGGVAAEEDPGLDLVLLTFQIRFGRDRAAVGRHSVGRGRRCASPAGVHTLGPLRRGDLIDEVMLGSQHQIGCPEQGVGPGGEHLNRGRSDGEQRRRTGGAADPVALHGLDLLRPVQDVEIFQ